MGITVSLDEEPDEFIQRCIDSGVFSSANEVIDVALRLMALCASDLAEELKESDDPKASMSTTLSGLRTRFRED